MKAWFLGNGWPWWKSTSTLHISCIANLCQLNVWARILYGTLFQNAIIITQITDRTGIRFQAPSYSETIPVWQQSRRASCTTWLSIYVTCEELMGTCATPWLFLLIVEYQYCIREVHGTYCLISKTHYVFWCVLYFVWALSLSRHCIRVFMICNALWTVFVSTHGPLTRYVILWVAHVPGMPGTFSPPPRVGDPDMHHGTCVTHVP